MLPNPDRIVKLTRIKGAFSVPAFVQVVGQPAEGALFKFVEVSTVCLEGAHLESIVPGLLTPEHGYETMVFLGDGQVGVYKRPYNTKRSARKGHEATVAALLAGTLPLSIQLGLYCAYDREELSMEDSARNPLGT